MIVRRLPIADHALLRQLAVYLATVVPPPPPWDEHGDWLSDIEAGPPAKDQPKPLRYRRQFMTAPAVMPGFPGGTMVSALNFYPPGGAGIGWHTDSGKPGWRIYVARPLTDVPGFLMLTEGAVVDTPEIATAFYISGEPCATWHAVYAEGPRLSIGVRIRNAGTARDLGLFL